MVGAKNYPAADDYYQKALATKSEVAARAARLGGIARAARAQPKDAIALYQKILQTDPTNDEVHKRLACCMAVTRTSMRRWRQQLQHQEQLETNPADTRTKIGLAVL